MSWETELLPSEQVAGIGQSNLGRFYIPDPRDAKYPLSAIMPVGTSKKIKSKHHLMGRGLQLRSQGNTPHCVRYHCAHLLQANPIVRADAFPLTEELYPWAQRNDEWPGENYDGTSLRAGYKYLLMQGLISGFYWARNMDEVRQFLTLPKAEGGGPLGTGIDWWSGMDNMQRKEDYTKANLWTPTGRYRGGHALVISGYSTPTAKRSGMFRFWNSHAGNFAGWMEESAVEYLLFQANGEAAAVREVEK